MSKLNVFDPVTVTVPVAVHTPSRRTSIVPVFAFAAVHPPTHVPYVSQSVSVLTLHESAGYPKQTFLLVGSVNNELKPLRSLVM